VTLRGRVTGPAGGTAAARRAHPVVGVTCDFLPVREGEAKLTVFERYSVALHEAGATAVFLPPDPRRVEDQIAFVDGLLLPGGDDLDPTLWGGSRSAAFVPSDPRRTEYEMALAMVAIERDLPVLGVCLGAQLLNVACGGSLRADLEGGSVPHLDESKLLELRHDVDVMKGSLLARALGMPEGGRLSVNSAHKNAPDGLGGPLRASAIALDGIIEAVEHRDRSFVLGVQWHAEHGAGKDAASSHLFKSFVEACARRAGLR
jgi:putative glutamine amidotransferase